MLNARAPDALDKRLTEIFCEVFKNSSIVPLPSTNPTVVEGWDSMTHMRLVLTIEERFGIKFKMSEIAKFRDLGELNALIQSKLAGQR